jgi:ABC-2 type transport system ATP-binding protein
VLELLGLRKEFPNALALDNCTLRAARGRVVGFLGRNGAGKTTAMRSIFRLVALDAGRTLWDGAPITDELRTGFGYMPEERGLYPRMRAREQIVYFARLRGLDTRRARAEADSWLARLGLEDRAADPVTALSHGNQQRLQLIVSLVGSPPLLVLDEPFSGLDPLAAQTLSDVIRSEAARGAAVLFSSHQLDLVEDVCDDVAIISRGRVVLEGDLNAIRRAAKVRYVSFSAERLDPGGVEGIADAIPGASIVRVTEDGGRLSVPATTSPTTVMDAINQRHKIMQFSFEPPVLADIFAGAAGE